MKLLESNVRILHQESGVVGLFKFIELVGRLAYKSEDKITNDSYIKFVEMIYKRGHFAVFDLGTVYLEVNKSETSIINSLIQGERSKYNRWIEEESSYLITTNYRIICQLGMKDIFQKYWVEPSKHFRRLTYKWICSRGIAQELLRHKVFCPVMESTRYVNYSHGRHSGELSYIIPQWIYKLRDDLSETTDILGRKMSYLKDLRGRELWDELCILDRTVSSRDNLFKLIEDQYLYECSTTESIKLKPEDARGILPTDIKTELCMTGYLKDWNFTPDPNTPEKAGFFNLRCAKDAHPDVRVLAIDAKSLFYEGKYDQLR